MFSVFNIVYDIEDVISVYAFIFVWNNGRDKVCVIAFLHETGNGPYLMK